MSDFLTNLASRSLDPKSAVRPRLPSLYEPLLTADRMMAGVLFDPADRGQEEVGDPSFSNSPSLEREPQSVPTRSPAQTAQPSRIAPAYQSDELLKTPQHTYPSEEVFRAPAFAPDKSESREPGAVQPRELSSTDFSAPQRRSDPIVPTAMIHSPLKETSPSPDSASSSKSPEANPEYEIHKDLRILLEGLVDQARGEPHETTSTTQPPASRSEIVTPSLSVTEEASRSAPDQVVHSVTIQRIVPAGESHERFAEVEDKPIADKSVQETASAEETRPSAPSPPAHPVTSERLIPAGESPPRFVATGDVSLTRAPVQETASTEEGRPKASSPAVHPVTIERIVPAGESSPRFVSTEDVSLTRASVRETASARDTRLHAPSPPVHPATIERIVPAGESSRPHFFFAKGSPLEHDGSPARTTVPTPKPTTIVVHPEISQVRPAAEMRVDSPAPEPNVQVTIGRIEVRAIKAAEVQPKNDRAAQSTLMSLDDYLRQRAQGGKR